MKYKFRSKRVFNRHNFYRVILIVIIFFCIIFLLATISKKLAHQVDKFITPSFTRPGAVILITEALNSEIFFNDYLGGSIFSDNIVQDIEGAKHSLDIAMYSFKSPLLRDAVYRAAGRGVQVRLVLDWRKRDVHDQIFTYLPTGIERFDLGSDAFKETVLMHHKFAIIDRGQAGQKLLFGSYNWTELQEKYDPSFLMRTDSPELINSFGQEFDRLTQEIFGPKKLLATDYHPWALDLQAGPYRYELWFSPGDKDININRRILHLIREAEKDIKIMVWNFTDKFLAEELVARARSGIKVSIIADNYNYYNAHSIFLYLEQARLEHNLKNLEIIRDDAREAEARLIADKPEELDIDPFLHHHLLLIDDSVVLFGTNNWSRGGAYFNDESIVVTDDENIVQAFLSSFQHNYQVNR